MASGVGGIPESLYAEIHRQMPIVCVDIIVRCGDGIVLIERDCEPARGEWWFCGGRVFKGENLQEAAQRIVSREAGLTIQNCILLGHGQTQFDADPFGHGEGTHTINFVFCTQVPEIDFLKLTLDDNHTDYRIFKLPEIYASDMHPYIKRFTGMAESVFDKNL